MSLSAQHSDQGLHRPGVPDRAAFKSRHEQPHSERDHDESEPLETDSCSAFTLTRLCLPSDLAISGVVTIAAAAPSDTPQQSNRPQSKPLAPRE